MKFLELAAVLLVLFVLAAIVVPRVGDATDEASRTAFAAQLGTWADALTMEHARSGRWPDAPVPGAFPAGIDRYRDASSWIEPTPIGGRWTLARDEGGVEAAVGVSFDAPGEALGDGVMTEIDEALDDGDLAAGRFRKLGPHRYASILAER